MPTPKTPAPPAPTASAAAGLFIAGFADALGVAQEMSARGLAVVDTSDPTFPVVPVSPPCERCDKPTFRGLCADRFCRAESTNEDVVAAQTEATVEAAPPAPVTTGTVEPSPVVVPA